MWKGWYCAMAAKIKILYLLAYYRGISSVSRVERIYLNWDFKWELNNNSN